MVYLNVMTLTFDWNFFSSHSFAIAKTAKTYSTKNEFFIFAS